MVVYKYDLVLGTRLLFDFGSDRYLGEFIFVFDDDRWYYEDGGWLVGFVYYD